MDSTNMLTLEPFNQWGACVLSIVPSFKLSSSLTPTASSHSSSHLYQVSIILQSPITSTIHTCYYRPRDRIGLPHLLDPSLLELFHHLEGVTEPLTNQVHTILVQLIIALLLLSEIGDLILCAPEVNSLAIYFFIYMYGYYVETSKNPIPTRTCGCSRAMLSYTWLVCSIIHVYCVYNTVPSWY